jgi:hypothetical protein
MPKSRQRKNHKKKVQARKLRIKGIQNKYQNLFNKEMSKYLESLSGETAQNETETTTSI